MSDRYPLAKRTLLVFFLIGSVAFILLLVPNMIKSTNGHYCSVITNNPSYLNNAVISEVVLDSPNEYFYEENYLNNQQNNPSTVIRSEYCILINNTGSNVVNANIINEEEKIINKILVSPGKNVICNKITNNNNNFLGVKCLDCNTTQTLSFYRNSVTNNENIVFNDEPLSTSTLSTTTKDFIDCKELNRKIALSYIIYLSLLSFAYLIILCIDGFEDILPKWK